MNKKRKHPGRAYITAFLGILIMCICLWIYHDMAHTIMDHSVALLLKGIAPPVVFDTIMQEFPILWVVLGGFASIGVVIGFKEFNKSKNKQGGEDE